MASAPSLSALLSSLTGSLTSSLSSLPPPSALHPPPSSFSLLSTKNELFLAYLQNLTFLVILNLRAHSARTGLPISFLQASPKPSTGKNNNDNNHNNSSTLSGQEKEPNRQKINNADEENSSDLRDTVVENLIGLRVYLERGVRPLEGRLKYQLDKLLLAAPDHTRESANHHSNSRNKIADPRAKHSNKSSTGTNVPSADGNEDESNALVSSIPPLAHRPNPSALMRPSSTNHAHPTSTTSTTTAAPYRPPRVNPTAPPTGSASKRAPRRSRAVDAFIREEMGDAPVTEMSIGAGRGGSADGGKQAERERERKEWEETKLVRLPGEKKRGRGAGDDLMAGMDWGLMDDDRGEGREWKRKKKGKSMNAGSRGGTGKRIGRK